MAVTPIVRLSSPLMRPESPLNIRRALVSSSQARKGDGQIPFYHASVAITGPVSRGISSKGAAMAQSKGQNVPTRREWIDIRDFGPLCCANKSPGGRHGFRACGKRDSCPFCVAGDLFQVWDSGSDIAQALLQQLNEEWSGMFGTQAPATVEQGVIALSMILRQGHCTRLRQNLARFGLITQEGQKTRDSATAGRIAHLLIEIREEIDPPGSYQVRAAFKPDAECCLIWYQRHMMPLIKDPVAPVMETALEIVRAALAIAWFKEAAPRMRTPLDGIPNFYGALCVEIESTMAELP
jgi:hypothetical protein